MSDVVPAGPTGTLTLTQEELNTLIAEHVKSAMAAAQPGFIKQTPEEALGSADLPVTPEVSQLLSQVEPHKWTWLLSVDQVRRAIIRGRPAEEMAVIFDVLNGHGPNGTGPAVHSLTRSAA